MASPDVLASLSAYQAHAASLAETFDAAFETHMGPISPLSASFPLMRPSLCLTIILAYIAFVTTVPPLLKATGLTVKLKPIMRVYNLFMVALSAYMGTKSILLARASNDTVFCVPLAAADAGDDMANLVWLFTFSKVIEFLDTFFMVVEGRFRQLSVLHMYHHVSIFAYWFAILWVMPGSDAYFSLAGNSYIHVLMYCTWIPIF